MNLTRENLLILLCSKGHLDETDRGVLRQLMSEDLNWKEILYQSVVHRQLNMVYYQLQVHDLLDAVDDEIVKAMRWQYSVIESKNRLYFKELTEISRALNEADVRAVVLKGVMLSSQVYPALQTRYFNDVDFLIKLSDAPKVTEVLYSLGYVQGQFDTKAKVVNEVSKSQKRFHQLTTHELQEFLRPTDNPFVDVLEVDINHSILWVGNCPYSVNNEEIVDRAVQVELNGAKTYVLNLEDGLIQLACHLFREATIIHWIKELRDLKIYKFSDIFMYLKKYGDRINWGWLLDYVAAHKLNKILYYVFHYLNQMYGPVVDKEIMARLEPENKDYLDEYGVENDSPSKWACDFSTRLFDLNRVQEVYLQTQAAGGDFETLKNQL